MKFVGHVYNLQTEGSLSSRRAWIEISRISRIWRSLESLSSRRAWIEIPVEIWVIISWIVALLTEGVD